MATDPCVSYASSCEERTFADSLPSQGYEDNRHILCRGVSSKLVKHLSIVDFTYTPAEDIMYPGPDADGAYPKPRQLGTIFIYIAPCKRLIRTALRLVTQPPQRKKAELWEYKIRIDDRLYSSCCHLASQNVERLKRILLQLDSNSSWAVGLDFPDAYEYLNIDWIERRLYDIEESEVALEENIESSMEWCYIFESSSYNDPKEDVAAVFIIGEEVQVIKIMSMPPFPTEARQPRAPEVYKMSYQIPWKRDFIGTFMRNPWLEKVQNPVAPISPAISVQLNDQQPPSIVQPAEKKRKLASGESSTSCYEEGEEAMD